MPRTPPACPTRSPWASDRENGEDDQGHRWFRALDEVQREQALDFVAIDFLGGAPAEAVERLERAEASEPGAAREIDGGAAALFEIVALLQDDRLR